MVVKSSRPFNSLPHFEFENPNPYPNPTPLLSSPQFQTPQSTLPLPLRRRRGIDHLHIDVWWKWVFDYLANSPSYLNISKSV
ncbi:hypothetical protein Droror1_Dr00013070 [Drosera rotundifolia]